MTSIEEINGVSATFIYRLLGYSADKEGLDNSILNDVFVFLKSYNLNIHYTENYFYEEFWFYFFSAAQINAIYPLIQFGMNKQLTTKELVQTNIQSVYNAMRSLAYVIPRDRANIAGVDISITIPNKEFDELFDERFSEYSSLIKCVSFSADKDNELNRLIEAYVHHLYNSIKFNGSDVNGEVVKMAFRYSIIGKYQYFYSGLKEYVLKHWDSSNKL